MTKSDKEQILGQIRANIDEVERSGGMDEEERAMNWRDLAERCRLTTLLCARALKALDKHAHDAVETKAVLKEAAEIGFQWDGELVGIDRRLT